MWLDEDRPRERGNYPMVRRVEPTGRLEALFVDSLPAHIYT